jgi:DNA-binding response OmpR family regulator
MKYSILVVEDNTSLRLGICSVLEREGYLVLSADSMETAIDVFRENTPDFVILDIMLPDGNGYDLIQGMKRHYDPYILMLTALGDAKSKKIAYEYGADDYACKPFDLFELIYKLQAAGKRMVMQRNIYHIGDVHLTISTGELVCRGQAINIPPSQASLLQALYKTYLDDTVLTLKNARALLPFPIHSTKQLHTIITRLRNSLSQVGSGYLIIDSIYGQGYNLIVMEED